MKDFAEQSCLAAQNVHHIERRSTMKESTKKLLAAAVQELEIHIVPDRERIITGEAIDLLIPVYMSELICIRDMIVEALGDSPRKEEK